MSKPYRILLTGATGFLGSSLALRLIEESHQVVVLKRSWSKTTRIDSIMDRLTCYDMDRTPLYLPFKRHSIDFVIHCATNYGRNAAPPAELIQANLILPLELLELAKEHQIHAFINTDTLLPKGVSSYSLSKSQFSDWLQQFSDALVCMDVVLEHFYGPHDDPTKFVTGILEKIRTQVPEIPLTPGEQKRDFVYISDVVGALMKILDHAAKSLPGYTRFEVGTGLSIPIRQMVTLAKEISGNQRTKLLFGALPYRSNEPMDIQVDTSKLRALGWEPKIGLADGLRKTLELE